MAVTGVQLCLALILLISGGAGSITIMEYIMDDHCGSFLDMRVIGNYFKLRLTRNKYYNRNMDCGLQIRTPNPFDSRLFIQFLEIYIDCSAYLQFHDGPSKSSPKMGSPICGDGKPDHFVTSSQFLYLRFTSDGRSAIEGFTLLISSFHTDDTVVNMTNNITVLLMTMNNRGVCSNTEFQCSNFRCIDRNLRCNEYDYCGDESNRCYNNYRSWVGIVVGIVVFLAICIVLTIICCCLCKRSRPGKVITNTHSPVYYKSSSNTVTPHTGNPWYETPSQPSQPIGQRLYQLEQLPYQGTPMPQPPSYTPTFGTTASPPARSDLPGSKFTPNAPPPYSEKPTN